MTRATDRSKTASGSRSGAAATSPWTLVHPVAATLDWCAVLLLVFLPLAVRTFSRHGR